MSQQYEYTEDQMMDMLRACKEEHGVCTPRLLNQMDDACSASAVMRRFGSWSEAKERAGIEEDASSRTGRKRKYTDEDVLADIRECAQRHDGKCTVALLQEESDLVAPSVAVERFGSWSEAKKEAGIETDERTSNRRPRKYSDEDYLDLIRECYEEHGKVTQKLFNQRSKERDDHPTAGAVRKRFGSWSGAKEKAGIEDTTRRYDDEELLEMLRTCKERYGTASASRFASDDEFCSPETLQRRFGSWEEAKEKAGVD